MEEFFNVPFTHFKDRVEKGGSVIHMELQMISLFLMLVHGKSTSLKRKFIIHDGHERICKEHCL